MSRLSFLLLTLLLYSLAVAQSTGINGGGPNGGGSGGSGTVTSVTCGTGLSGGVITTVGVCALVTPVATASGGTGTISALTGIVRGGSPFTAAELSGDVTTSGSNATTIAANAVTNAKAAQMVGGTIKCNPTSTAANAVDCNPLQATVLQNVGLVALVATFNNITLSGLQTIDGTALAIGNIVFVGFQTTSSQDGIYIVASGAWTRAPFFPSGMVLAQNCNIAIFVMQGTAQGGHTFELTSLGSSSVTIGTSSQTWGDVTAVASVTKPGVVKTTVTGGYQTVPALRFENSYAGEDCASFFDANGSVTDNGNVGLISGPCVVSDAEGHFIPANANNPPTVNHGTVGCAATDQSGCITGLSAATTVTITFDASWGYTPSCSFIGSAALAAPTIPTASAAAITLNMTAFTGTLYYSCH